MALIPNSIIGVSIIEPLALTRAALAALVEQAVGLGVVDTGTSPKIGPADIEKDEPTVWLAGPGLLTGSAEWLRRALAARPQLKVVVLANPDCFEPAVALVSAGAAGCVLTSDPPHSLFEALRAAARGEPALSGEVVRRLVDLQDAARRAPASEPLSEREQELLGLLGDGLSNKEIAQRLYLSVRTVEAHLRSIYGKLGVRSRLEAALQVRRDSRSAAS